VYDILQVAPFFRNAAHSPLSESYNMPEDSHDEADNRPIVLLLGDFAHEGVAGKMESMGYRVINKRFRSSAKNWRKIIDLARVLRESGSLAFIIAYVPTPTLLLIADEEYDEIREVMIAEWERTPTLIFVYESNLQGTIELDPWGEAYWNGQAVVDEDGDEPWRTTFEPHPNPMLQNWREREALRAERARVLLAALLSRRLEIVPFKKRSDVMIRIFECLEDNQQGVFLRVYVTHGRYQSEQFEDFLTVFSRYLRDVEGREFSVDVQRTARGSTYVFKGRGDVHTVEELREATSRFDLFLSLAEKDPRTAENSLVKSGLPANQAAFVVAKYARAHKRMHLEIRHEYERRRLLLRQEVEADLLDSDASSPLPILRDNNPSSLFSIIGNSAPVTINLPTFEQQVQGNVKIGNLSASSAYSPEEKEILARISEMANDVEALRLRSELDRLKDVATPPHERRTAVQKLKSCLYSSGRYLGKKVDEIGTKVLVAYLEKQLPTASSS
jgi:hypothetical protein